MEKIMQPLSRNVIVIVLDSVRADRLGVYGYGRPTSPVLDEFALSSLVYEDALAAANWSVPSHAALFTGLYPSAHNVNFRSLELDLRIPTLAELLSKAGYATCAITSNAWISEATGLHRGFRDYLGTWPSYSSNRLQKWVKRGKSALWSTFGNIDKGGPRAIRELERWLKIRTQDNPFFLFMNLMEAHPPYSVPKHSEGMALTNNQLLPKCYRIGRDRRFIGVDYLLDQTVITFEEMDILSDFYDAGVRYTDELLGRVLDVLESNRVLETSLLIITSDHGESLGDEGVLGHQFKLTLDLLHVPLLLKFPNHERRYGRVSSSVQLVDIFPTVLDYLGINNNEHCFEIPIEGISLLDHESLSKRRYLVAEDIGPEIGMLKKRHGEKIAKQWDVDRWLFLSKSGTLELHSDNSYHISEGLRPAESSQMLEFAEEWRSRHESNTLVLERQGFVSGNLDVPADLVSHLRNLGYMD